MLSDPDLLDVVRRLRTFMTTFDNAHIVLDKLSNIEDQSVTTAVYELLPNVLTTAQNISTVLKKVEGSKQYREMAKRYNISEDEDDT